MEPKWFRLALLERGVIRGELNQNPHLPDNPKVVAYYKDAGHPEIRHDRVPWCAAFVGAMLARSGIKPSGSLMARSYLNWGTRLSQPKQGCIVIFSRGSRGQGHVTFFDHWAGNRIVCLGGNQSNAVTMASYPTNRVLGYRWPIEETAT